MKVKKSAFALLLSIVMVFGLLPAAAFAGGPGDVTELPRVGGYREDFADQSALITDSDPFELRGEPNGEFFFVICSDDDLSITDLAFEDRVEDAMSWEQSDNAGRVWRVGLHPDFPADCERFDCFAVLSNGDEERFGVSIADHRPALVWHWADRHWEDAHEDAETGEWIDGGDVFTPRTWERPEYVFGVFPGMDACGRFELLTWEEDNGDELVCVFTPIAYNDLEFAVDGQQSIFDKTEENNGCYNLYFYDFGVCTVTYVDEDLHEYVFRIFSDLPDVGFYDNGVFDEQTGELIELNDNTRSIWMDAHLAAWDFDGENDTVWLVARDGAVLTDAHECGRNIGVDVDLSQDGTYAAVALTGDHPHGDRLELDISGVWGHGEPFEHHMRGLSVCDKTPHLAFRYTDWDNGIPYISHEWGEGYETLLSASPGEDRVIEIALYEENGNGYPEPIEIDPAEVEVISGPAELELVQGIDDECFLRVRFTGFGPVTLSWTGERYEGDVAATYTLFCESILPDVAFYSALPDTEQEYYDYYISQWDYRGGDDAVWLVARGDKLFTRVESDCDSILDIDEIPNEGVQAAAIRISELRGDRINVRFWGTFNEGRDEFGGEYGDGRELRVNDVSPGLCFRFTDWDNNGPFIDYNRVPDTYMDAAPGERRIVEVYLRGDDGVLSQSIDPAQLVVTGSGHNMNTSQDDRDWIPRDERIYLNISFDDFGEVTLSYASNGVIYSRTFDCTLPGIGFYSEVPETEEEYYEYYLNELNYHGEPDAAVFLVMRGDGVIYNVWNYCDNVLDIDEIPQQGAKSVRIGIEELLSDRIEIRVQGDWGGGNLFGYPEDEGAEPGEGRGIHVNDLRPGHVYTGLWIGSGETEITADYGDTVTLRVEAGNFIPEGVQHNELNYRWYRVLVPAVDEPGESPYELINSAIGPTMTLTATSAGTYRCVVGDEFNDYGPDDNFAIYLDFRVSVENGLVIGTAEQYSVENSDTGDTRTVTADENGFINILPGEIVTLEALASATDSENLRYQWFRTNFGHHLEMLDGCQSTTFEAFESDEYMCWAIDKYGNVEFAVFNVEVQNDLRVADITPSDRIIYVGRGDQLSITVSAESNDGEPLNYAWYLGEDYISDIDPDDTVICRTDTLTIDNVNRDYDLVVDIWDNYNNHMTVPVYVRAADGQILYVSTQDELAAALSSDQPVSAVYITESFTIDSECLMLFDTEHYENYHNAMIFIRPDVTLSVADGGSFGCHYFSYEPNETSDDPTGFLYNAGTIIVADGGEVIGSFDTNEGTVTVEGGGTCVVPLNNFGDIYVHNGGALLTSQGTYCCNFGTVTVDDGGLMEARFGSTIFNEWGGCITLNGEFRVGVYKDYDLYVWFENYGECTGHGRIILYPVVDDADLDEAVESVMQMLGQEQRFGDGFWDDIEIYRELRAASFEEISAAFPGDRVVAGENVEGDMDTIVRLDRPENNEPVPENPTPLNVMITGNIATMGKIIIPDDVVVTVTSGASLSAGIDNYGVVNVLRGGELATTMGSSINNFGTIAVDEGASLITQMGQAYAGFDSSILKLDGKLYAGCIRYPDDDGVARDHVWFEDHGGEYLGSGTIILHDVGQESGQQIENMAALIARVQAAVAGSNTITVRGENSGSDGLVQDSDGVFRYYRDGVLQSGFTGFVPTDYGTWYIIQGVLDRSVSGLVQTDQGWQLVYEGQLADWYTGLFINDYGTWYIYNGLLADWYAGLVGTDYGWWYVYNGQLANWYTGLVQNEYGWWYVYNGQLADWYTGLVGTDYGWWYVYNGQVANWYTDLVQNDYGWWYVYEGQIANWFTGLVQNDYGWWYVYNGQVANWYTDLVRNEYGWWYVYNGQLANWYTGLIQNDYGWWYIYNGQLADWFTGLVQNDYGWWYIYNGQIANWYTGVFTNDYGTWFIYEGSLGDWFTGSYEQNGVTYQFVGGHCD